MDTPTKTQLNKLKVAELRGQLTGLGLPTNGIKADLVQRLFTHFQEQAEAEEEAEEEYQEEESPPAAVDYPAEEAAFPPAVQEDVGASPEEEDSPVAAPEVAESPAVAVTEPEPEPVRYEAEASMEESPEPEQPAGPASGLTMSFSAPVEHPAGPPPAEAGHERQEEPEEADEVMCERLKFP